ncbi:MAG: hypothetical protein HQK50_03265 [Oligoflexia bacterium]|nr:hypothetical protein [Oligoflexia bacterium]
MSFNRVFLMTILVSCVLALVLSASSIYLFLSQSKEAKQIEVNGPVYKKIVQGKDLIADVLPPPEYIIESYLVALQLLQLSDKTELEEALTKYQQLKKDYYDRHTYWNNELPKTTQDEEKLRKSLLDLSYDPADKFYKVMDQSYLPSIKEGKMEEARKYLLTLKEEYTKHRIAIEEVVRQSSDRNSNDESMAKEIILSAEKKNQFFIIILAIVGGIILALNLVTFIFISRGVRRLSCSIISSTDKAFEVTNSVMANGNTIQASTTKQSNALQSTSATIEEITSNMKNTTENVLRVSKLTEDSVEMSNQGAQLINLTKNSMGEIADSAKKISQIISLVNDIAFQTNILAINAAIEAAKASEHGKGFAVVAIEVRDLAQRTAESAKDIRGLIELSLQKVDQGQKIVEETNKKTQEIVVKITEIQQLINQVSTGAQEQYSAVSNINSAISELDLANQELNSIVNQLATSSEEMNKEIGYINKTIKDKFAA